MLNYAILLQIALFLFVFYQDLKERKVLLISFIFCLVNSFVLFVLNINTTKEQLLLNYLIIAFMMMGIAIYCKYRKLTLKQSFGLGDAFFFIIMATSFSTISFIQNFVFSLIFSLLLHLIFKNSFKNKYQETVPLAGFQALYCSFLYSYNLLILSK